jgi:subtilisin-like proprotein convertase family protein/PKD repeat protein
MNTTSTPPANATWKKITAVCLSAVLLFFVSLQSIAQVIPAVHCNSTAATATFTQATPTAIPTGPAVVTSTLVVSGANTYLFDLNVTTFITHSFAADLDITITSPSGTVVTLTTDNGAGNDNVFNGTIWDDDANPAGTVPYTTNNGLVTDNLYADLTLASPLVPEEALGAFIGENPNGTWTITISDDLTGDGGSLDSWSMELTGLAAAPSTFFDVFSDSPALAIPTGPGVVSSTITVSGIDPYILDLNVVTNITHTFSADLDITVTSPAGTVVTLTSDNGAGNDDVFAGTTWNDQADPDGLVPYTTNDGLVSDHLYANLTLATPLVPEDALSAFIGEDPNGIWTITISDDLAGDGGILNSWGLDFATIGDVVPPSITCGGDITVDNVTGTCSSAAVTLTGTASATDACSTPTITYSPSSGSTFPVGTTTVTATAEDADGNTSTCTFDVIVSDIDAPEFTCAAQLLHDNGPLVNSVGTGFGGADESMLETTSLGMGTIGFGHQVVANNRVADDFTITNPNGWTVDQISFYAYQTGSSTTSTMTAVNLRIWDGVPDGGGTVIFGDGSTNLLVHSEWSGIYRVTETTSGNTTRPIMKNTIDLGGLTLPAGTYWLDWQTDGTLGSGPWAPPVTILGQSTTGNGLQSVAGGAFAAVVDGGTFTGQDFPFVIVGSEVVENDLGVCEAFVTIEAPLVLNECSGYTVTNDWNNTSDASDNYPVGITTVTWTITDDDNNVSTCSFDVTVEDTEDPTICPGALFTPVASYSQPILAGDSWDIISGGALTGRPFADGSCCSGLGPVQTDIWQFTVDVTGTYDINQVQTGSWDGYLFLYTDPFSLTVNPPTTFVAADDDGNGGIGTSDIEGVVLTAGQNYYLISTAFENGENGAFVTTFNGPGNVGTLGANTCQGDVTISNDAGLCSAVFTYTAPVGDDNCPGSVTTQTAGLGSGSVFPLGTTTEEYTVTDAAGNTAVYSFDVTVEDTEAPVITTCSPDVNQDNDPGDCGAVVTFVDPVATDNCPGTITYSYSPASGSYFSVGTTTVTATAEDVAGNTATCTFDVTISDTEDPELVCPANITVSNDAGLCTANVTYTAPVGTDNCAAPAIQITQSQDQSIIAANSISCNAGGLHANNSYMRLFDLTAMGYPNTITFNSVDVGIEQAIGASGTQPATVNLYSLTGPLTFANLTLLGSEAVTIADQTGTVLNIPLTTPVTVPGGTTLVVEFFTPDGQVDGNSIFVGSNNLGQTGATYLAAADCGVPEPLDVATIGFPNMQWVLNINAAGTDVTTVQIAGLPSGSDFPVGTTTNTFEATDIYGNTSTCSFNVVVNDVEVPTISCGSDPIVCNTYASTNVPVALADLTTSTSTLTVSGAGVSINDVNVLGLSGTHTFIGDLSVTLTSPSGTVISLTDFGDPCGSQENFNIDFDDAGLASGTYPCPPTDGLAYEPSSPLSALNGENPNGVWTVTFTDAAGGDVGQLDAWSLEICTGTGGSAVYAQSNDIGDCGAVVTIAAPTSSDNCPLTLTNDYNGTDDATDFYPVGTTVVEWTVTDPSGNEASCSVTVVVTDDEFPVFDECPATIFADNDLGQCGAIVTYDPLTATDNCPLPAIVQFSYSGSTVSIPDATPSGTSASLAVSGTAGNVLGTDIFLQSVCIDVSHTWIGDLNISLQSPDGTIIPLVQQPGFPASPFGCAGDDIDACFETGTGNYVETVCSGTSPSISGTYTAAAGFDLDAVNNGGPAIGIWLLLASDNAAGDLGSINGFTLSFNDEGGVPAPIQTAGLPSGSEFPVGTTTNTFEVTDAAGNTTTCSFDVVVSDVEAPAIVCPGDIAVDNDAGVCGAVVDYDAPTGFQQHVQQLGNSFENGFVSNSTFPNIGADNLDVPDGDCWDISNVTANFFVTSPTAVSSFDILFYDDNSGEPGNVLNTVNLTSSQWTTSYQGSNFGFDVYEFNFTLPSPVSLCGTGGGTPYWFSIVANGTGFADFFWEVSTLGAYGSEGVLSEDGGPWDDSEGIDFVFELNDMGNTPDNCVGPVTITQTDGTGYTDGDVFPIGTTLQRYVAEDQYGNVDSCEFTVTVLDTEDPVITCAADIIACDGDVITYTVSATDNCPGETIVQTAGLPSGSVFPLGITTNSFEVTDASGNTATCSFDVNVTPVPVADYTYAPSCVSEIIYFTSTATVDPSGGTSIVSHEWEFNDGSGINTDVNPTHVYNTPGDYDVTLTVTTNWGCEHTVTYTVTVSAPPVYTVDVAEPTCNGDDNGSITINVTGGNSPITFSLDGGPAQSGNVFSGLEAGTYVITMYNGCTETVSVTVGEPAAIIVDASSQPVLCNGDATGSIEVTATGGTGALQYSIDGGNTFQSTGSFSGLTAGSYVVVVEDENGCSVSEGVVITEPSAALAATADVQNVSCTGDASGSVVVNATGGTGAYTYSSDGGTTTQSSNVFGDLAAGDYTITVTDANGCSTTVDATVAEPAELLTLDAQTTPVSCNGEGDGEIELTATGGNAPYEYSFNGGITYQSSGTFGDLAPGTYTVLVRDANGCEVAAIVVVTQPDALELAQTASSDASCEGDDDGSFTVEAEGGTAPYTYTSNGNSNSTGVFSSVTSGIHVVTVTDASGCSASVEVEVGYTNPLPVAAFNWFASGSVVQFTNQSTNGTSYAWDFGDGSTSTDQNPVHTYAAGGTYTVTLVVTNACGTDTITWTIDTNNIGINDPNGDASVLNVYPNPNHGVFTLSYTSTGIIGDIQVNVMTIEGKLLMAEQFTVNADTFTRNYSDIELAAGIYIVQFVSQNKTEVKRITVDK